MSHMQLHELARDDFSVASGASLRPFRPSDQRAITTLFRNSWRKSEDEWGNWPRLAELTCPLGLAWFVALLSVLMAFTSIPALASFLVTSSAVPVVFRIRRGRSTERYLAASEQVLKLSAYIRDSARRKSYRRCWVVEDGKEGVVGFIVVQCGRDDGKGRAWLPPHAATVPVDPGAHRDPGLAVVQWLAVGEKAQRLGVGSSLLRRAEQFCRTLEPTADDGFSACAHLRLVCSSFQHAALKFYKEAHGFTEEHRTNYREDAAWESGVFLWKPLR